MLARRVKSHLNDMNGMTEPRRCLDVRKRDCRSLFERWTTQRLTSMLVLGVILATSFLWFLIFMAIPMTAEIALLFYVFYSSVIFLFTIIGIIMVVVAIVGLTLIKKKKS